MLYYETEDKRGKRLGVTAALGYVALWVVLMLIVSFSSETAGTAEGIMIDFGDSENAWGGNDPSPQNVAAAQHSVSSETEPDDMMTQDFEDAPQVNRPENSRQRTERQNAASSANAASPTADTREVNRRALFPGRTEGSASTSEGSGSGTGNQGSPDGAPQGSHEGTGVGSGGTGFDLAGRNAVALPPPVYDSNQSGKVVIEITVNAEGVVVSTAFKVSGSTTNDEKLVNAALRAARQSRFNAVDGEGLQRGTITYNFKLK